MGKYPMVEVVYRHRHKENTMVREVGYLVCEAEHLVVLSFTQEMTRRRSTGLLGSRTSGFSPSWSYIQIRRRCGPRTKNYTEVWMTESQNKIPEGEWVTLCRLYAPQDLPDTDSCCGSSLWSILWRSQKHGRCIFQKPDPHRKEPICKRYRSGLSVLDQMRTFTGPARQELMKFCLWLTSECGRDLSRTWHSEKTHEQQNNPPQETCRFSRGGWDGVKDYE